MILLFILVITFCQAQQATYDMTTISGSTLTDVSGNGHDGTISGVTNDSKGINCSGSPNYVSLPAITSGDFTVGVVAKQLNVQQGGMVWSEANAALTRYIDFRTTNTPGIVGASGSVFPSFPAGTTSDYGGAYHYFYIQRSGTTITIGILDYGYQLITTATLGTVTTTAGAICARTTGSAQDQFWAGSVAWEDIWTSAIDISTTLTTRYNSVIQPAMLARGILMPTILSTLTPGPVWRRLNVIVPLVGAETYVEEISVLPIASGCMVLSSPCYGVWFTSSIGGINYGESPDGVTRITRYGSILNGYSRSSVFYDSGTYYLTGVTGGGGSIAVFSSTDPVNFSLLKSAAIPVGTAGSWDTVLYNSSCLKDGSTFVCAYEAAGTGNSSTYQCGIATSSSMGSTFTKSSNNPISGNEDGSGCSGPWLTKIGSTFWMWAHADHVGAVTGSDGVRGVFNSGINGLWQKYPGYNYITTAISGALTLPRLLANEGTGNSSGQLADVFLLQLNANETCIYYDAVPTNTPAVIGDLRVACAAMPLTQLITTSEGGIPFGTLTQGNVTFSGKVTLQ